MNYVELEQEEMMYLDGADATNFCNNLEGVWNSWSINVSKARVAAGWSWALFSKSLAQVGTYGYSWAAVKFGIPVIKIASFLGGFIGGFIAGLEVSLAVSYVWNNRVWY